MRFVGKTFNLNAMILENQSAGFYQFISMIFCFIYIQAAILMILSENPEINALYGIKNKKAKASEKIANFFYLIKVLRANKYDLIVNLNRKVRVMHNN